MRKDEVDERADPLGVTASAVSAARRRADDLLVVALGLAVRVERAELARLRFFFKQLRVSHQEATS